MSIGPPVYWVVKGPLNYSNISIQNMMCGGVGCSESSLTVQLYTASQQSEMYTKTMHVFMSPPFNYILVLTLQQLQLRGLTTLKIGHKQAVAVNIFTVMALFVRIHIVVVCVVPVPLPILLTRNGNSILKSIYRFS